MTHLSDILELIEDEENETKVLADLLVALAAEPEPDTGRGFKVGDILSSSWGYDQTNITFYQVLKVTPKTVTVREIRKEYQHGADMVGTVLPIRDSFPLRSEEKRRTVIRSFDGSQPCLKMESYEFAYLWKGNPEEFTSYA
jgi:hypothetical protein